MGLKFVIVVALLGLLFVLAGMTVKVHVYADCRHTQQRAPSECVALINR